MISVCSKVVVSPLNLISSFNQQLLICLKSLAEVVKHVSDTEGTLSTLDSLFQLFQ